MGQDFFTEMQALIYCILYCCKGGGENPLYPEGPPSILQF